MKENIIIKVCYYEDDKGNKIIDKEYMERDFKEKLEEVKDENIQNKC